MTKEPTTTSAATVAAVCAELLGLASIGMDDDLYDLGSDSQQAVLIALRIEKVLEIDLPLEVMENSASVRTIAAWVDAERARREARSTGCSQ